MSNDSSQSDRGTAIPVNCEISQQAFGSCCADGVYLGFELGFELHVRLLAVYVLIVSLIFKNK